jgi:hypothetical protein
MAGHKEQTEMTTRFSIDAHAGWPVHLAFFDPQTNEAQEDKVVRPNCVHDDYVHSGRAVRIVEIQEGDDRPIEGDARWVGRSGEVSFSEGQLAADPILKFFGYAHLPQHLQSHSKPFAEMASRLVVSLPRSAERTVALRKLLECKDAAVRAALS